MNRTIALSGGRSLAFYEAAGPRRDAPAVLLLHGLGITAHLTWCRSYGPLSRHFRVLAFDLRGHGRGLPTRRFTLEDCARDALDLAAVLDIPRIVLAGYSLGGSIAQLAWRLAPRRVAGLVLAATASPLVASVRARRLLRLAPLAVAVAALRPHWLRRQLVARTSERLHGFASAEEIERELERHDPSALVQAARAAASFSSESWLPAIDVPSAVVVTREDDRIAPDLQRALAVAIAGASLYEVPGRHTACATNADTFAPALVLACRDVWRRADGAS